MKINNSFPHIAIVPNTNKTVESRNTTPADNKTDLSLLNNYKRDLVSFNGGFDRFRHFFAPHNDNNGGGAIPNPLDKFVLNPDMDYQRSHRRYYIGNMDTMSELMGLTINTGYWNQTPFRMDTIIPWKMHIYADTEKDWAKLIATVGKYLNTQKVDWKTLGINSTVEDLNTDSKQKGKAITVYSSDKKHFKKIAHDIDYIIRKNGMEIEGTSIVGDRKLGDTGRIFYRFDHKSGATKDNVYHYDNDEEMEAFDDEYASNRGKDRYIAPDMTVKDDPFYRFNPQKPLK